MGDFLIKLVRPDLAFSSLRDFIELGGDVLLAIMLATFIMWALIIERYWHFATSQKGLSKDAINHGMKDQIIVLGMPEELEKSLLVK